MKFRHNLIVAALLFYPVFYMLSKSVIFIITSVFLKEEINSFLASIRFEQMTELIAVIFLFLTFTVSWFFARPIYPLISKYLNNMDNYIDEKIALMKEKSH